MHKGMFLSKVKLNNIHSKLHTTSKNILKAVTIITSCYGNDSDSLHCSWAWINQSDLPGGAYMYHYLIHGSLGPWESPPKQYLDWFSHFWTTQTVMTRPTVFSGKFCQIPQSSSGNSMAHCGKIEQIPWLNLSFLFISKENCCLLLNTDIVLCFTVTKREY